MKYSYNKTNKKH